MELLLDLRLHFLTHNSKILKRDNPTKLLIGWEAIHDDDKKCKMFFIKVFAFKMHNIQNLTNNIEINTLFLELIQSSKGRDKLADLLCSHDENNALLKYLDRMLKMKAFW